jgi:hypothetical protein
MVLPGRKTMPFRSAIAELPYPDLDPDSAGEKEEDYTERERPPRVQLVDSFQHSVVDTEVGATENVKAIADTFAESNLKSTTVRPRLVDTGACWTCRRSLWWKDRYGNKKCGICHPPGNPDHIEWYDDQAEYFEERAAIIEHEAGLPQVVAEDLARNPHLKRKKNHGSNIQSLSNP